MTTLAADSIRTYEAGANDIFNDLPAVATDILYEGSAAGMSSGYARPLVAGDSFAGFVHRQCDNSAGAAGAKNVKVRQKGHIIAAVVGVTAVTDVGSTVYMSDDNVFTLSSTSNSSIGKIIRWISSTSCVVAFEAVSLRSI